MDEATSRAALRGASGWEDTENEGGDANSSNDRGGDGDDDDEEFGRRRSRRKRVASKKARVSIEEPHKPAKPIKAAKKPSPPKDVDQPVGAAAVTTTTTTTMTVPKVIERLVVNKEEALEIEICRLEQELFALRADDDSDDEEEESLWKPPRWCVPIRADVRTFDFDALAKAQKELTGRLFDVIVTDPPWQLATSNPTRGVALGYEQLTDNFIRDMPFGKLQDNGFLFMWVINAKYRFALSLFELWGYELVDEITWVKQTVNRRLAKSHGFYLQHAKETCLVARKGRDPPGTNRSMAGGDVIFSERRGQSQKPTEIYNAIERLVPNGFYLEIFGRRNNTRDGFLTIGNEL
jgi:mRNA (2'-O-methyladenosine-N6-)-methyltransferase